MTTVLTERDIEDAIDNGEAKSRDRSTGASQ